jgi:hypothetical protein
MSKRRYFLLDEDVPLALRGELGRKSIVESIEQKKLQGLPDDDVIDLADQRTSTIITNDAGMARLFRERQDRKTHDACHYGLVLITAPNEEAQKRLLKRFAKAIVWNEVAEQDMYVHIEANGRLTAQSLCTHSGYARRPIQRRIIE